MFAYKLVYRQVYGVLPAGKLENKKGMFVIWQKKIDQESCQNTLPFYLEKIVNKSWFPIKVGF